MKESGNSENGGTKGPTFARGEKANGKGHAVTAVDQQERLSRERIAVFERAVSSVSHALGTPLQVISGRAAMIRMDAVDDGIREHARIIEKKVQDVTQLMHRLLEYARGEEFEAQGGELSTSVHAALGGLEQLAHERGVTLELKRESTAPCVASPQSLLLLATNLLVDAIETSATGGVVRVSVSTEESPPAAFASDGSRGAVLLIELSEKGSPEPGAFERAHEPWMKPDPGQREGGLRRAVVAGVLRRTGGVLEASLDGGTRRIRVWLPS